MPVDYNKVGSLLQGGSPPFEYSNAAAIPVGAANRVNVNIKQTIPAAGIYMPLDSMRIYNNSAQPIKIYFNSLTESITVPSLMIQPINRQPFSFFIIENMGAANIAIGEILIQMRRLPPDIQQTVNIGAGGR